MPFVIDILGLCIRLLLLFINANEMTQHHRIMISRIERTGIRSRCFHVLNNTWLSVVVFFFQNWEQRKSSSFFLSFFLLTVNNRPNDSDSFWETTGKEVNLSFKRYTQSVFAKEILFAWRLVSSLFTNETCFSLFLFFALQIVCRHLLLSMWMPSHMICRFTCELSVAISITTRKKKTRIPKWSRMALPPTSKINDDKNVLVHLTGERETVSKKKSIAAHDRFHHHHHQKRMWSIRKIRRGPRLFVSTNGRKDKKHEPIALRNGQLCWQQNHAFVSLEKHNSIFLSDRLLMSMARLWKEREREKEHLCCLCVHKTIQRRNEPIEKTWQGIRSNE